MLENIDCWYGSQFVSGGMTFRISDQGMVRCDDGMEIGHLEDCLEEGKTLMDLVELISAELP